MTWTVRAELPADVAQVRRVVVEAFGREDEAELVDALRGDAAWLPGLASVAVDGAGRVVGYALLTRCHIGEVAAVCLGPCAVLPEVQRSGAGGAAVRGVLEAARVAGERWVVVLGHPEYYPRFGFVRASGCGVSVGFEVPDEALMVLSLDGSAVPSGVVRYAGPFGVG